MLAPAAALCPIPRATTTRLLARSTFATTTTIPNALGRGDGSLLDSALEGLSEAERYNVVLQGMLQVGPALCTTTTTSFCRVCSTSPRTHNCPNHPLNH